MTNLHAEPRVWTSAEGRTLEAELIKAEGDALTLRRTSDYRLFTLPLSSLSEADQTYVSGLAGAEESTAEEGSPGSAAFPDGGLVWPRSVEADGDFEVEILAEKSETGEYRYRAGHFVFSSDTKLARKVVQNFAEVFEATYSAVQAMPLAFNIKAPEGGYQVQLFAKYEDYLAAGAVQGSGGTYSPSRRLILVPMQSLGVKESSSGYTLGEGSHGTLIHEITHQVQHDWLAKMPIWMIEGFADYMEAVPFRRGEFIFNNHEVEDALMDGSASTDEFAIVSLNELMNMSGSQWNAALVRDPLLAQRQYRSAYFLVYYFAHLDGDRDGRRLWEALRAFETIQSRQEARRKARDILLNDRSYHDLFEDMQRAYRSEGIKLLGG